MLRNILDNWVVVPVGKNSAHSTVMFSMPESSAQLWKMLEKGAEESELIAFLTQEYAIDAETAGDDVRSFLAELDKENMLVR